MAFTQDRVAAIHSDIRAALDEIAKKHGLNIGKTHISYNDTTFKFSSEIGDSAELGDTNPVFFNYLRSNGWRFGLKTEDMGREFTSNGSVFAIEGMKGTSKVIAKLVKPADAKMKPGSYRFDGDYIRKTLGRKVGEF